jgi:Tat protein secretion system quality control protein TatD with DNase activity
MASITKKQMVTIILMIACLSLLGAAVSCAPTGAKAPHGEAEALPIINVHMHLTHDMAAETLMALMESAGVKRMVLMARYLREGKGSDEQSLEYARKYPGRFIPFVGGQRPELRSPQRWLNPDEVAKRLLVETEGKLRSGAFYGVGELILRHYSYKIPGGGQAGELDIPPDTPLMRGFVDLGAQYNVPLTIHAEAEPQVVSGLVSLLKYNPKAKIIWAHSCGRSSAKAIRELLAQYPNLLCDLANMVRGVNPQGRGYGDYFPRSTPWIHLIEDGAGRLYEDMRKLYEDFPDRFLLGTDNAHTPSLRQFVPRLLRFRQLLSGLSIQTAERIAYRNAEDLFHKEMR